MCIIYSIWVIPLKPTVNIIVTSRIELICVSALLELDEAQDWEKYMIKSSFSEIPRGKKLHKIRSFVYTVTKKLQNHWFKQKI